jgi:hypothetical protein
MTELIPPEAITAAAEYLHDDECNDGDTQTCGRWRCGSDPANQFHALHVAHVGYYRERAAAVLAAASPVLRAADQARIDGLAQAINNLAEIVENRDRYIEQLERQAAVRETTP